MDPTHHPGFAGRLHTPISKQSIRVQIPRKPFPYHATIMTEVAFVMPTLLGLCESGSAVSVHSHESAESMDPTHVNSFSSSKGAATLDSYRTLSGNLASCSRTGMGVAPGEDTETPRLRSTLHCEEHDCAAMVVWLENFEDHAHFPLEAMTSILHSPTHMGTSKGVGKKILPTIFIHKLSSGLYQIAVRVPSGR